MYFARIACLAVVGLALSACSSSSSSSIGGPVIDDFTVNDTASVATVNLNGKEVTGYDIKGTVSFHDDTQNVTQYVVHLDIPNATTTDQTFALPNVVKQATNVSFDFVLDQNAPKGSIGVTLRLIDAAGVQSDAVAQSTTLQ